MSKNVNILEEIKKLDLKELSKLCRMYPNLFKGYKDVPISKTKVFVVRRLTRINKIYGGEGDKLTINDVSFKELDMGIVIEYEHKKSDIYVSMDIDYDHLAEYPDYYTRLYSMEDQADKYWKNKSKKKWVELEQKKMLREIKKSSNNEVYNNFKKYGKELGYVNEGITGFGNGISSKDDISLFIKNTSINKSWKNNLKIKSIHIVKINKKELNSNVSDYIQINNTKYLKKYIKAMYEILGSNIKIYKHPKLFLLMSSNKGYTIIITPKL